jgi:streptogramin lyase
MEKKTALRIVFVWAGLGAALAVVASHGVSQTPQTASMVSFRGVVNDGAGNPVRGVIVTATTGFKSVSRFTDQSGRYEMTALTPGHYEVSVAAWGFGLQKRAQEISSDTEIRFQMEPDWNVARLSTTDWLSFLPEEREALALEGSCVGCHNLNRPVGARGRTAADWRRLMVLMESRGMPHLPEARLVHISGILEKYFGPKSPVPNREQIRRPAIPDPVLQATFREYATPSKGRPLSIIVDSEDNAWFDQGNINKIGRFNIRTETFQEYPIPTPKAGPHTLAVGQDGRVWITMASSNQLTSVDPKTGRVTEYRPDTPGSPHIPAVDAAGNVWYTDNRANLLWRFDPRTEKFSVYKVPVPETYPQDSIVTATAVRGEPPMPYEIRTYGIAFDSQGKVWFAEYGLGKITRFDPATEQFTQYTVPGTSSLRGLDIDKEDNVWFANFLGHKLGKLNARTGEMRQFQPPTRHAAPYGVLVAKDGTVWYTDSAGNHVTSFNPKTEHFVEYPVPTADPTMRFMGQDSAGRIWFAENIAGKIGSLDPGKAGITAAASGNR